MTPRTSEGKLATMVYALFGVPLMLMCLSSLGGLLAEALQCAYCRFCPRRPRPTEVQLEQKEIFQNGCAKKSCPQSLQDVSYDQVRRGIYIRDTLLSFTSIWGTKQLFWISYSVFLSVSVKCELISAQM